MAGTLARQQRIRVGDGEGIVGQARAARLLSVEHFTADGRVLLALKAEWTDGTTHLLFEPVELLERLAALTPRPRINLVLHHGVLAPHSRWRARVVAYGREPTARLDAPEPATAPPPPAPPAANNRLPPSAQLAQEPTPAPQPLPSSPSKPRAWSWADLLRYTFAVDVLACPWCGGRMRVIATIDDPVVIRKILTHLGLPTEVPAPRPPPRDLFDG